MFASHPPIRQIFNAQGCVGGTAAARGSHNRFLHYLWLVFGQALSRVGKPLEQALGGRDRRPMELKRTIDVFRASTVEENEIMFGWALTFLIVALIAAVLGFGGIAGFAVEIAQLIFYVAIILLVISVVVGLIRGRTTTVP
jgi:uncharacterized membrane protein YtjA (UPF0391 family)